MSYTFAPTHEFARDFAKNHVLPLVLQMPEVTSGEPFRLVELTRPLIERLLTDEEKATPMVRAGVPTTMQQMVRLYCTEFLRLVPGRVFLERGVYAIRNSETNADLAEELAEELDLSDSGYVYAYSFPELIKDNEPFAIKVGYTDCDVDARVRAQCKGASSFSHPVVLGSWKTDDAYRLEQFVHAYLKFHKRHRTRCSGTEWFDTTLAEIERVISFGLSQ